MVGSGWEEKLKYLEDKEKLEYLKSAGFNGYHLSQIVYGSGWEEKLKYFEDKDKLEKLCANIIQIKLKKRIPKKL